jgi:hypothetical protein
MESPYPSSLEHHLMLLQLPRFYFWSITVPCIDSLTRLFKADSPIATQPVLCLPVRNREVENLPIQEHSSGVNATTNV